MDPYGSKWLQMAIDGYRWLTMAPDGSRCLQMPPDASSWLQMAPYGSRWLQMALDGSRLPKYINTAHYCEYVYMRLNMASYRHNGSIRLYLVQMALSGNRWLYMTPNDHK
jgi:hypothetical protein